MMQLATPILAEEQASQLAEQRATEVRSLPLGPHRQADEADDRPVELDDRWHLGTRHAGVTMLSIRLDGTTCLQLWNTAGQLTRLACDPLEVATWLQACHVAVLRFDAFDDAVSCCADFDIPFFVDNGNKKLVFWFVRTDDHGRPEIARCTEREFASLASHLQAGAWYCPDCGTVHYPHDEDTRA